MQISALSKYKGFIFDLDGTLINSMPYHAKAWRQTSNEYGFDIDEQLIFDMGGASSLDIALHLKNMGNPVGDPKSFVARKIQIFTEHIEELEDFKSIQSILIDAKKRGCKIAIGTGTREPNALKILILKNLMCYVDALVTSELVEKHKPHPDTFLLAAKKLGLKNDECVVFEDGQLGILAAINGGFDCVEVSQDRIKNFYEIDR